MKHSAKVFLMILSSFIAVAMIATVGLSVMTYLKVDALEQTPAAASAEEQTPAGNAGEDDIKIGGSYMIRSTKAISDAYLSGDSSALSDRDRETLDMASKVLDGIITEGMTDYEKEKAVFLWMNEHIGGDENVTVLVRTDTSTDNPHGVLSGHSAVCVGYATTFRLFMQMLDIPCMVVHDTSLVHSWDLVQIDGHWYHVDLYSAQGEKEPLQLLNRSDALQQFLGSDWDLSFYPAADSMERCYIYQGASKVKDLYQIPAELKKAIDSGSPFLSLILPDIQEGDSLLYTMMETMINRLSGSVEYGDYSFQYAAAPADDGVFVYVKIDHYDYTDDDIDPDVTDEERERIEGAINDGFGTLTDYDYDDDYYDYDVYR